MGSRRMRKMLMLVVVLLPAALVAGCSGSSGATSSSTPASPSSPTPSSTASTPSSPSTPASSDAAALSGTWSGHYSGAYRGTFTLTWTGSGSKLTGTIKLSTPPNTLHLTGAVKGNTITFGTVGSSAITYTGKVSGDSMAGTYRVGGSPGGPWSATRS
jgi:hypothetical protein